MKNFSIAIKFGLFTGLILIAYSIIIYVADVSMANTGIAILSSLITFGILIAMAVIGINKTRDGLLMGKITFVQAFLAGVVIIVIANYLSAAYSAFFNTVIDPEYMVRQMDDVIANLEGKLPEDTLDTMIERLEKNMDPNKIFIRSLWMSPIVASVISAIIALVVKKDKTIEM